MAETTLALPPRPRFGSRFFKSLLLLRESTVGMIGAGIVLFWILCAVFAPLLAPFEPNSTFKDRLPPGSELMVDAGGYIGNLEAERVCAPVDEGENAGKLSCGPFWLGTDEVGRDILSRILWGARQVLVYAPIATLCAYLVGIPMGLLAGYRRGWVDSFLSFVANVILSFPVLVLYILIITTMEVSGLTVIVAIIFASAPGVFRIVRGLALDLRAREYVAAAETRGEGLWFILLVEILPNARGPLIVDSMLRLGYVIIAIGTLGFLGLGLPPPDPDWGQMIATARVEIQSRPYMALFPCLAISSLVLGFNLLADGLREVSLRD